MNKIKQQQIKNISKGTKNYNKVKQKGRIKQKENTVVLSYSP